MCTWVNRDKAEHAAGTRIYIAELEDWGGAVPGEVALGISPQKWEDEFDYSEEMLTLDDAKALRALLDRNIAKQEALLANRTEALA